MNKIASFFKNMFKKKNRNDDNTGIIIFDNVKSAMKAESILKKNNYNISVVAPPPEIREGCDLAIAYDLVDETGIKRTLKDHNVNTLKYIPLNDYSLKPLELIKVKEIDGYKLIRCGNMKITINKSGDIVNVSGGGCPDVPYLSLKMRNKNILEIPDDESPQSLGYSLCAYTLHKAFEKGKELVKNNDYSRDNAN